MIENVIARRYARGLAEYAAEQDELDAVRSQLEALSDVLDPSRGEVSAPELLDWLRSPRVTPEKKIQVTDVLCAKLEIGKTVSEFLNVLIRRNRVGLMPRIARFFESMAAEMDQVLAAEVETARALDEQETERLRGALETALGSPVRMLVRERPELRGGVRVRAGDQLLDGSLAARLARLEASLAEA
jgi:F-type H+-transporting ATPase subunit delta